MMQVLYLDNEVKVGDRKNEAEVPHRTSQLILETQPGQEKGRSRAPKRHGEKP